MSKLRRFDVNTRGKDYICADVHGYFDLLEARLRACDFDPAVDRVFSLGDLIDRGPDSPRALEFLAQPWFHAVLGNHEIMLLEAVAATDQAALARWHYWGGAWAAGMSWADLQVYYDAFVSLPVAAEVALRDGRRVGLVHAELPDLADWGQICAHLDDLPAGPFNHNDYWVSEMLWSKTQCSACVHGDFTPPPVRDIDHVFHGHTVVAHQPLTAGNRTFMDLGTYIYEEIGFVQVDDFLAGLASDGR